MASHPAEGREVTPSSVTVWGIDVTAPGEAPCMEKGCAVVLVVRSATSSIEGEEVACLITSKYPRDHGKSLMEL